VPETRYEVTCKHCGRTLAKTERIRCGEVAMIRDHIQACSPLDPLGEAPPLGEIMARIRVASVERL